MDRKEPLYRRVNAKARGARHGHGGEYRWERAATGRDDDPPARGSMHAGKRHGLDYTPLFRFLLSRVGRPWDEVLAEAMARLDRPDPIWWMVSDGRTPPLPYVRIGETSYFSGLEVRDGRLALVDPSCDATTLEPGCSCCTWTFNGRRLTRPYRWPGDTPPPPGDG